MNITDSEIKINNKTFARYEIFIEAWDYHKNMRFPIKNHILVEDEFNAAIDMCESENKKIFLFTYIGLLKSLIEQKLRLLWNILFNQSLL